MRNRAEKEGARRTLQPVDAPALASGTKAAVAVAACDLNADRLIDLVVTCRSPRGDGASLRVLRNKGNHSFEDVTARSGLAGVPVGSESLLAVDWNNDLDVDLLVPGTAGSSGSAARILFLKGRGLARFRPQLFPIKDPDVQSATSLAVLDADSNGSWDLLASGPHGMLLMLTTSIEHDRVERLGVEAISDFAADHMLIFDYDNEGRPDLIAWKRDAVRCLHGSSEGHFQPAEDTLPSSLGAIASADFGDLDQ